MTMTMTSARSGPARSRTMVRVGLLSLGAAIVILGGLALQMALGRDPALGPRARLLRSRRSGGSPDRGDPVLDLGRSRVP